MRIENQIPTQPKGKEKEKDGKKKGQSRPVPARILAQKACLQKPKRGGNYNHNNAEIYIPKSDDTTGDLKK